MLLAKQHQPIIILDFGSQYTQLIARRVRELGVYCEIYPFNASYDFISKLDPCGYILSGGPASVAELSTPKAPQWLFEQACPILGICYGMQAMAANLGGLVTSTSVREFGYAKIKCTVANPLLSNLTFKQDELDVWMSHGDKVTNLPPNFVTICTTDSTKIAGMANIDNNWYGLQFHPEVTHTQDGQLILKNFVVDICNAKTDWIPSQIVDDLIKSVQAKVGSSRVVLGLSGGVDSSVVAALLHRAIGKQLTCIFVDTGLLRLHEADQVQAMFAEGLGIELITVSAEELFLSRLENIKCPEEKRKIIGRTFIDVFDTEAQKLKDVCWLAQGTIYPDVIESAATETGAGAAEVIKSHHNVGGLPDIMNLKLLEPIRALFKDEVRKIGMELGLPREMVYRHPFPGPGLAVRILGEVHPKYIPILQQADAIFLDELQMAGLYDSVSQAFAVFLPVKSVAVLGDGRSYDYVICLRAVETTDFMTANWARLPFEFLARVSNRIINEVRGVSRVTYDISGKPPATIEWE